MRAPCDHDLEAMVGWRADVDRVWCPHFVGVVAGKKMVTKNKSQSLGQI